MPYFLTGALMCGILLCGGCSPTFNWRDIRTDLTPLVALFPCKPDTSQRVVPLGGQAVNMTMLSCDAGGATFSLAYADMQDAALSGKVLSEWKANTLGNIRTQSPKERPFLLKGADVLPQSVQVEARGTRPNGTAVSAQAVWFAVGAQVFQAAVYADRASPAEADTYFSGLRIQ